MIGRALTAWLLVLNTAFATESAHGRSCLSYPVQYIGRERGINGLFFSSAAGLTLTGPTTVKKLAILGAEHLSAEPEISIFLESGELVLHSRATHYAHYVAMGQYSGNTDGPVVLITVRLDGSEPLDSPTPGLSPDCAPLSIQIGTARGMDSFTKLGEKLVRVMDVFASPDGVSEGNIGPLTAYVMPGPQLAQSRISRNGMPLKFDLSGVNREGRQLNLANGVIHVLPEIYEISVSLWVVDLLADSASATDSAGSYSIQCDRVPYIETADPTSPDESTISIMIDGVKCNSWSQFKNGTVSPVFLFFKYRPVSHTIEIQFNSAEDSAGPITAEFVREGFGLSMEMERIMEFGPPSDLDHPVTALEPFVHTDRNNFNSLTIKLASQGADAPTIQLAIDSTFKALKGFAKSDHKDAPLGTLSPLPIITGNKYPITLSGQSLGAPGMLLPLATRITFTDRKSFADLEISIGDWETSNWITFYSVKKGKFDFSPDGKFMLIKQDTLEGVSGLVTLSAFFYLPDFEQRKMYPDLPITKFQLQIAETVATAGETLGTMDVVATASHVGDTEYVFPLCTFSIKNVDQESNKLVRRFPGVTTLHPRMIRMASSGELVMNSKGAITINPLKRQIRSNWSMFYGPAKALITFVVKEGGYRECVPEGNRIRLAIPAKFVEATIRIQGGRSFPLQSALKIVDDGSFQLSLLSPDQRDLGVIVDFSA